MVRLIFRHITGSRASQVDVVAMDAHRELVLGRATSAAVRFDPRLDRDVGRFHARIVRSNSDENRYVITDLESTNGTYVNGNPVTRSASLAGGDTIKLGAHGPEIEFLIETIAIPAEKLRVIPEG